MFKRKTKEELIAEAVEEMQEALYWLTESDTTLQNAERLIEQEINDEVYGQTKEPMKLFKRSIRETNQGEKHRRRAERLRRKSERR